jgi:hypothetical protein
MSKFKFAIVVGNDVAGTVALQQGIDSTLDAIIAAYQSDPKIIPITDDNINFGWTYDGTNFFPPLPPQG